ncbi:hypothetical protein [Streptomyces inhibens]|uniref:hypothetical protein n=1 Tax=Streptomyces inhibens TaxID=2293571 RepID=UPI001EE7604F|nr:hypothetical protein [Streptomyces inhibens]UKY47836.1 hypothetical protein KI385_02640 [Streptomyces inhibens]
MKKAIAGIGVVLGSAALLVATQGPAQAADAGAPAVPAAAAAVQDTGNSPQIIGGLGKLAQKAWVHGKAAAQLAGDAAAEVAGNVSDAFGNPPSTSPSSVASVETVFDK